MGPNFKKNWNGSAQTGERTSQRRLRPLHRHGRRAGGKTLNGRTLVGKITNGTIIHGEIIHGDQSVRMRCFIYFQLAENSDSLVSDGRCTQNTSPHAHFSVLSVFQVFCTCDTFSHSHTCVWLNLELGLKNMLTRFCAHSPKHSIRTPCHS